MSTLKPGDTAKIPLQGGTSSTLFDATSDTFLTADVAGVSHRGHVRSKNEDHFVITRFGRVSRDG